jgi:hypothetical protein
MTHPVLTGSSPDRRGPTNVVARWGLGLVGVAVGVGVVSGRAALYVRGYFLPILGVMAVLMLVLAWRRPPALGWRTMAVLLLPAVAGMGIGPPQASRMAQVQLAGSPAVRLGDGPNPLLKGGGGPVSVLQVDLAAQQLGPVSLLGRRVSVEAEVVGPSSVERLVMVCCAADARPVTLTVQAAHLPQRGAWVEIEGQLSAAGGQVVLVAGSVRRVPVPPQPIL